MCGTLGQILDEDGSGTLLDVLGNLSLLRFVVVGTDRTASDGGLVEIFPILWLIICPCRLTMADTTRASAIYTGIVIEAVGITIGLWLAVLRCDCGTVSGRGHANILRGCGSLIRGFGTAGFNVGIILAE